MGLPASQRRILERIENALRGSDPRLAALFSIFTRLNRDEEMPRIEQVRARAAIITRAGSMKCIFVSRSLTAGRSMSNARRLRTSGTPI